MVEFVEMFGVGKEVDDVGAEVVTSARRYGEIK